MSKITHILFFAPLFSDDCGAKTFSLSLQDVDDFDVSVYADNIDPSSYNSADWELLDCSIGKIVACSEYNLA